MRVLFLTLYPDTAASPRYRVAQFLPYLRAHGVTCDVCPPMPAPTWRRLYGARNRREALAYHLRETWGRVTQLLRARHYDVVFVQKALMSAYVRGMTALLRRIDAPLVYDLDDAVHLSPPHPLGLPGRIVENREQVKKVATRADLVLAGNRWLVDEMKALGAPAVLFPTVVDTDRFTPGETRDTDTPPRLPCSAGVNPLRVGWIGTPSTTPAVADLGPVLAGLAGTETVLVGADAGQVHWDPAVCVPWSYEREAEEVRRFSVGIMPLRKDTWTRGKCALKALLYMASGVPCVATPFGAVRDIIRNGENGLFADEPAAWRDAFERLRDPVLRRSLGEAGRATVEGDYSLKAAAPRLLSLLEGLR